MPPQKSSRMTANPVKPSRYRPGKALAESRSSPSSSGDEDASDAPEDNDEVISKPPQQKPHPNATSFPADAAKKVTSNLRNVDLNARRRQDEARERAKKEKEYKDRQKQERDAGFVTESDSDAESDDDDDGPDAGAETTRLSQPRPGSESTESSEEEDDDDSNDSDSSDSSAPPPRRAAPVFLRKDQRSKPPAPGTETSTVPDEDPAAKAEAEAARRAAQTDAMVQERLERDAAARAAGKKSWGDDEPDANGLVDDTDGLDEALERAQWVSRELSRLKRARQALEEREAEIAEVARRRELGTPEREAEDRARVEAQQAEKKGRAKAGFMQVYHHKGAFYHDEDAEDKGLLRRDLMGATYESGHSMKDTLPQYLQVRDSAMIGRKGRTKYKDLRNEDTGRWGDARDPRRGGGLAGDRGGGAFVDDERFRPDGDVRGATGANASAVGERKRPFGGDGSRLEDAKRPKLEDAL